MIILPAVDILGGKCVRLWQGDYARETVYGEDPVAMAQRWIRQGAKFLHLVDLDGARQGFPYNQGVILDIVQSSPVPVEVGGGIRTPAAIEGYLSRGVNRVILGTSAYADPLFLKEACAKWPGKVAIDIAAKNGIAAITGWAKETEISAVALAKRCEELGASLVIYTDILRDGTQKGLNLPAILEVAHALKIPLIASGGVSTIEDIEGLRPLEKEGVIGVIVGKALYSGTLKLAEAITRLQEKED